MLASCMLLFLGYRGGVNPRRRVKAVDLSVYLDFLLQCFLFGLAKPRVEPDHVVLLGSTLVLLLARFTKDR